MYWFPCIFFDVEAKLSLGRHCWFNGWFAFDFLTNTLLARFGEGHSFDSIWRYALEHRCVSVRMKFGAFEHIKILPPGTSQLMIGFELAERECRRDIHLSPALCATLLFPLLLSLGG